MAKVNLTAAFSCSLEQVWSVVTSLENYSWRSDITEIKVTDAGKKFVEYSKDGFATTFTVTAFEPMKKYAFDMDNENMHGTWVGLFSDDQGKTVIDFTEDVTAKKLALRPFVGLYLRKQQAAYVADLRKALGA